MSEPLRGVLLGASGSISQAADAVSRYERALRALDGAGDLRVARAELHLALAGVLHEQSVDRPEMLARAVPHYHSALQLVLRAEAPLLWAAARQPGDRLSDHADDRGLKSIAAGCRSAVAALGAEGLHREDHPEQWASVQLNLANSLVYTPSNHQADNLVEAVELYEAVLAARDRHTDPWAGRGCWRIRAMCWPTSATSTRPRPNSMTPASCSRNSVTMTRCAPYAGCSTRLPANRRWPEQKRRLNERGRGVARADLRGSGTARWTTLSPR